MWEPGETAPDRATDSPASFHSGRGDLCGVWLRAFWFASPLLSTGPALVPLAAGSPEGDDHSGRTEGTGVLGEDASGRRLGFGVDGAIVVFDGFASPIAASPTLLASPPCSGLARSAFRLAPRSS